jgi:hypothetical protein
VRARADGQRGREPSASERAQYRKVDRRSAARQSRGPVGAGEILVMAGSHRRAYSAAGRDNERALHELLGMTEDQIKGLYAKGILEHAPTLETHPSRA